MCGPGTVWTNTATFTRGRRRPTRTPATTPAAVAAPNGNGGGGVPAVTNPAADADNDGLPNGWEQKFGLNPLEQPGGGTTPTPTAPTAIRTATARPTCRS